MTDIASADYFTDPALAQSPFEYFDALREENPVYREPNHNVVVVTGHPEVIEAFKNSEDLSAVNAIGGPFPPLPFEPEGDDITDQIEAHRHLFPIAEHMVVMDPPDHTMARSLLHRLLTPKRLQENEEYIWKLADSQIDEFIDNGRCEFLSEYAKPFATLAITDLLGVPETERAEFRAILAAGAESLPTVGALDQTPVAVNPLEYLEEKFTAYLAERRRNPQDDILSGLATATYPDGTTPELIEVVRPATFLFAAGQETVTKLLSSALRMLGERPEFEKMLREDRTLIKPFMEESLRFDSPTKIDFRLARKTTTIGDVDIKAGTVVMLSLAGANRDPRKFENPNEFRLDRKNLHDHVAFGRGLHTCAGAPLARIEGRVTLNRLLDRMQDFNINEVTHGPADNRSYEYEPSFLLRGLTELNIEFTPAP